MYLIPVAMAMLPAIPFRATIGVAIGTGLLAAMIESAEVSSNLNGLQIAPNALNQRIVLVCLLLLLLVLVPGAFLVHSQAASQLFTIYLAMYCFFSANLTSAAVVNIKYLIARRKSASV